MGSVVPHHLDLPLKLSEEGTNQNPGVMGKPPQLPTLKREWAVA